VLVSVLLIALRLSLGADRATLGAGMYVYAGGVYALTTMVMYLGYLGGKFIV
jgi:hypothetical protein